jgi:hypothetical protein
MKKKIISIGIVVCLISAMFTMVGADAETADAYKPTYKSFVNGNEIDGTIWNINGNTYLKGRQLEELIDVVWDETNREAHFNSKEKVETVSCGELQKAVVRIVVKHDGKEAVVDGNGITTQEAIEAGYKVIGNGFFIPDNSVPNGSKKILTVRDVYDSVKHVLAENQIGIDTGDATDTIVNATGIFALLHNNKKVDIKPYRVDDDRTLGIFDSLGYSSPNYVELGEDMKIGDESGLCTSIESNMNEENENPFQVKAQWSFDEVKRIGYFRDGQEYTLTGNPTDNHDSGRGGLICNTATGKLTGIFCAVEGGNNGNTFVLPVSKIKSFLND